MDEKSRRTHNLLKRVDIFWIWYSIILLVLPYNIPVFIWLKQRYFLFGFCYNILRGIILKDYSYFNFRFDKFHFEKLKGMYGIDASLGLDELRAHINYKLYKRTVDMYTIISIVALICIVVYLVYFKGGLYPMPWFDAFFDKWTVGY